MATFLGLSASGLAIALKDPVTDAVQSTGRVIHVPNESIH